jgi:hypothetical protein
VILTLSVSSSALIGRAQPIPERVAALHIGDLCALPCWIGITPGVTRLYDAQRILNKVFNVDHLTYDSVSSTYTIVNSDNTQISVYFDTEIGSRMDNLMIDEIDIYLEKDDILIGDIVKIMDNPSYVSNYDDSSCNVLIRRSFIVEYELTIR